MKKFLKGIGIILLLGILTLVVLAWAANEELPQGNSGPEADILAHKMLQALNVEAYKNTQFLEWSYRGGANQYVWDKKNGLVVIKWDDITVDLNLNHPQRSKVFQNKTLVPTEKKQRFIDKALKNFNNDSFWLVAPYKVFDQGTQRSVCRVGEWN